MATPYIVMINPKNFELVSMFVGGEYRMSFFGAPEKCIAVAYTEEEKDIDGHEYLRIHSPGTCYNQRADLAGVNSAYRGQGYGLLLYAGVAAGVALYHRTSLGVFSIEGTRSNDASRLWRSLVKSGIATEYFMGDDEGEEEENDEDHCFKIQDDDREVNDGGWVTSREVCGSVVVTRTKYDNRTYTLIDGNHMLAKDFVLWAAEIDSSEHEPPPADLIVRARVPDREAAIKLIRFIREKYDEEAEPLVRAFVSRSDIDAMGINQKSLLGRPSARTPLPPLSARSKKLIDLFNRVED